VIYKLAALFLVLSMCACKAKENVFTEEHSASGLAYTLISMPNNTRITVRIAWPSNWAFSEKHNQAVPYIGTELLFAGGAEAYPAGELLERFSDIDSAAYLSATIDYILGTVHFSPEHQDETIKAANAHLKSPLLDEHRFNQTRDQFALRIRESVSSAEAKGFDALRWSLFGEQPIRGALSLDEATSLDTVTRAEVASWVNSVFKRKGATITIAGDLNYAEAGAVVDALFEGLPEGDSTAIGVAAADFSAKRILFQAPDSTTSNLSFIGKLPPLTERAELQDMLLTTAMTEHWQNGLPGTVDEELQTSFRFSADFSAYTAEHRFILLTGQIEASKIADAEKALRKAYREFKTRLPIEDLQKLKEPYAQDFKKYQTNSGATSNSALMAKLTGMDPAVSLNLLDELDAITEKSLLRRINTAFPSVDDFIVLVDSPDNTALPDACVITIPRQVLNC